MAGRAVFIVMAKITADKEEAFNKWYHEVHISEALERLRPAILSARRYKINDERTVLDDGTLEHDKPVYQYMTMYEFENYEEMQKALYSGKLKASIEEYNKAYGKGGRHHLRCAEVKSLIVGP
jgi:hypothetical protein